MYEAALEGERTPSIISGGSAEISDDRHGVRTRGRGKRRGRIARLRLLVNVCLAGGPSDHVVRAGRVQIVLGLYLYCACVVLRSCGHWLQVAVVVPSIGRSTGVLDHNFLHLGTLR